MSLVIRKGRREQPKLDVVAKEAHHRGIADIQNMHDLALIQQGQRAPTIMRDFRRGDSPYASLSRTPHGLAIIPSESVKQHAML